MNCIKPKRQFLRRYIAELNKLSINKETFRGWPIAETQIQREKTQYLRNILMSSAKIHVNTWQVNTNEF